MTADRAISTIGGVRMLAGLVGHARIAWLGLFMVLSSLTEGFGLLLLLPITRIVSGEPLGAFDGGWLGAIAQLPAPVVLAMAVAIISLRALIVYVVLELRHSMGLSLTRQLRTMSQQAVLGADWRWLSQQNSADHSALIVGEAARVGSLADQALSIATGLVTLTAPDPDALREAVEAASAAFVFALPQGLDTLVGEGGRQLSGGERQRLSLARALLRNPDLLILDEVTAALDSANEAAIMDTIARLRGSCTVLILGHRAALLDLADEIVDLGAMGADRASAD